MGKISGRGRWLEMLRKAARSSRAVDFVIITALEEERRAMLNHLPGYRRLDREGEEPHTYYEAFVQTSRSDDARYHVLVTSLDGMGPARAAAKAAAVVHRWAPRHVLLVGIAGGLELVTGLGDILVASQIADYTVGKRTAARRDTRWEVHRADATLLDAATNLAEGWEDRTKEPRPVAGRPLRHIGVVLSGGDVLADGDTLRESHSVWDKLIGVEMEGGGASLALHLTALRPRFLMIRAVSDLADEKKGSASTQSWRAYACDVAAAYTRALLESGPVPAAHSFSDGIASIGQFQRMLELMQPRIRMTSLLVAFISLAAIISNGMSVGEAPLAPTQVSTRPALTQAVARGGRKVCAAVYPCGASSDGATVYCFSEESC